MEERWVRNGCAEVFLRYRHIGDKEKQERDHALQHEVRPLCIRFQLNKKTSWR